MSYSGLFTAVKVNMINEKDLDFTATKTRDRHFASGGAAEGGALDPRIRYIARYRDGQRQVLEDCAKALDGYYRVLKQAAIDNSKPGPRQEALPQVPTNYEQPRDEIGALLKWDEELLSSLRAASVIVLASFGAMSYAPLASAPPPGAVPPSQQVMGHPALALLANVPELEVRERVSWLQEVTTFLGAEIEARNRYSVQDRLGNQFFYAIERTDCLRRQLQRTCLHE
eukprot:s226_g17.t2